MMRGRLLAAAATAALIGWSGAAQAACEMSKPFEIAVTMEGHTPLVSASINGRKTQFEADSGAFYSLLSPGTAAEFGLTPSPAPEGFFMSGIGGSAQRVSLATVKELELGGAHIPRIQFLVGGNEFGHAGLLGQNIFSRFEDEYDLAHGAIRLFRTKGCAKASLAYWAVGKPFSMMKIREVTDASFQTIGNVTLDGTNVAATFDTGASTSVLSLAAASRAGVRPNSPGVVASGDIWGIGRKRVRTWIGRFRSLKIGDNEEIKDIRIRFGDIADGGEAMMLMGADFFLSHRVLVDNSDQRLFVTYNGGPVFNLSLDDDEGGASHTAQAAAAIDGPDPADADAFSRRGAAYLARRDLPRALADLGQAVKLAPNYPLYHRQLATALLRDGKRDEAMAEIDRALAVRHDDLDALLMRAGLRLDADAKGARADADAFDAAAPRQANDRLALGSIYEHLHAPAEAIRAFSQWLDAHPGDIAAAQALNDRCWVRALANVELDGALSDCNRAVKLSAKSADVVDSRALVWFRRGDLAKARADYDLALAASPQQAGSLFMRGVVKARMGDKAASSADLAAAAKLDPSRAPFFADWGIKP